MCVAEVIDDRAATRGTIICGKLPVQHWHSWIGDVSIADATSCYGVTQRVVLQRVLASADDAALNRLLALPNGQSQYYDKQLPGVLDFVTQ